MADGRYNISATLYMGTKMILHHFILTCDTRTCHPCR